MMISFQCNSCERKFPKRVENIIATRKLFRKHLRDEHDKYGFDYGQTIRTDSHGLALFDEGIRIYN